MILIAIPPLTQSFYISGKSAALLFIHGFGASPSEVYPVAAMIHKMTGCTVSGPLLPGHGTVPEDLNKTNWTDWYAIVEKEMKKLQQQYDQVMLVGLSMGGLLALHAGCRLGGIASVTAINAPIFNRQPLLTMAAPVIQYIKPYYPKKMDAARARLEEQGRFAYRVTPVRAFMSMMQLRRTVMNELHCLTVPLLVVQSQQDQSVKTESACYIINHTTNSQATLLELKQSDHIATMGPEKDIIVQAIIKLAGDQSH